MRERFSMLWSWMSDGFTGLQRNMRANRKWLIRKHFRGADSVRPDTRSVRADALTAFASL